MTDHVQPMSERDAQARINTLGGGWQINSAGHLEQRFGFSDFMGAMRFANAIAEAAEAANHHPDLTITWGRCSVEIWTHDIDGLAEGDFTLAATIGDLYSPE